MLKVEGVILIPFLFHFSSDVGGTDLTRRHVECFGCATCSDWVAWFLFSPRTSGAPGCSSVPPRGPFPKPTRASPRFAWAFGSMQCGKPFSRGRLWKAFPRLVQGGFGAPRGGTQF